VAAGRLRAADLVTALKAAAEPTRLRILLLLQQGELNVKDLTRILGQSQPRLSRHLKLLVEAGLIERFREGSWVYFSLADRAAGGLVVERLLALVAGDDGSLVRDRERADALQKEREHTAQAYFRAHAGQWDRIRALHVAEAEVEAAMREALGAGPFKLLVDLGTGTGRLLQLLADRAERCIGLDVNQDMLAYARSNLAGSGHTQAHVRHGDIYDVPLDSGSADAVTMHQILHYLRDPAAAIREAARLLMPRGRLLVVDFAPHELEFLREQHAHVRLGFAREQVAQWMTDAGLIPLAGQDLLAPAGADGKLTVSLWLAERPAPDAARPAKRRTLAMEGTR
jgi:ubiquinone/menaquinone biosynthesis C-methylase UbiE/DNA-binding transcriptional ArsR family regulator